MKNTLLILVLSAILAVALFFAGKIWLDLEGVEMSLHGYAAMALGIVFSLAIGVGLMLLVFYSNRTGIDDQAHNDFHK